MPIAGPTSIQRCLICQAPVFDGRTRYCGHRCRDRDRPKRRHTCCLECGKGLGWGAGKFCASPCKAAFDERRKVRALELYDLAMSGASGAVMGRLQTWHAEDHRQRQGRPSWRLPRVTIDREAILAAYARGEPVAAICADFGIRPGSLYKIVTPQRDPTGRMGGRRAPASLQAGC
jgi:hypothetical protein